jgi:hypothetical protein
MTSDMHSKPPRVEPVADEMQERITLVFSIYPETYAVYRPGDVPNDPPVSAWFWVALVTLLLVVVAIAWSQSSDSDSAKLLGEVLKKARLSNLVMAK